MDEKYIDRAFKLATLKLIGKLISDDILALPILYLTLTLALVPAPTPTRTLLLELEGPNRTVA